MTHQAEIPTASAGVQGHLHLTASAYEEGQTYLSKQSFSAPVHLSKPFYDAGMLVVNLVNPTAGFLAWDRLEVRVRVESRARLLLTNPAATRIHRMKSGKARLRQEFSVAPQGFLELWPDLFIPQSGSNYEQQTQIQIEPGGELLFFEILTPGRVASGEFFAFKRLQWRTEIFLGDRLIVRERYCLEPETESLYALCAVFPQAYQSNVFVISSKAPADKEWLDPIMALHNDDLWVGGSSLVSGGWVIKILARDSLALRRGLKEIRRLIHQIFEWPLAQLRRC